MEVNGRRRLGEQPVGLTLGFALHLVSWVLLISILSHFTYLTLGRPAVVKLLALYVCCDL